MALETVVNTPAKFKVMFEAELVRYEKVVKQGGKPE